MSGMSCWTNNITECSKIYLERLNSLKVEARAKESKKLLNIVPDVRFNTRILNGLLTVFNIHQNSGNAIKSLTVFHYRYSTLVHFVHCDCQTLENGRPLATWHLVSTINYTIANYIYFVLKSAIDR